MKIKLDDIGEKALENTLERVTSGRLDPSLRKKNEEPESMTQYKRGEKDDAD